MNNLITAYYTCIQRKGADASQQPLHKARRLYQLWIGSMLGVYLRWVVCLGSSPKRWKNVWVSTVCSKAHTWCPDFFMAPSTTDIQRQYYIVTKGQLSTYYHHIQKLTCPSPHISSSSTSYTKKSIHVARTHYLSSRSLRSIGPIGSLSSKINPKPVCLWQKRSRFWSLSNPRL